MEQGLTGWRVLAEKPRVFAFFVGWTAERIICDAHFAFWTDDYERWTDASRRFMQLVRVITLCPRIVGADGAVPSIPSASIRQLMKWYGEQGFWLSTEGRKTRLNYKEVGAYETYGCPSDGYSGDGYSAGWKVPYFPDLLGEEEKLVGEADSVISRMKEVVLSIGEELEEGIAVELGVRAAGLAHGYSTRCIRPEAEKLLADMAVHGLISQKHRGKLLYPRMANDGDFPPKDVLEEPPSKESAPSPSKVEPSSQEICEMWQDHTASITPLGPPLTIAEWEAYREERLRLTLEFVCSYAGAPVLLEENNPADPSTQKELEVIFRAPLAVNPPPSAPVKEVPWADIAPGFLQLTKACELTDGRLELSALSKLLKPDGEMLYMRKRGVGCKVYVHDLLRYLQGRQSDPEWAMAYLDFREALGKGNLRWFWRCKSCGREYPENAKAPLSCPKCKGEVELFSKAPPKPSR